MNKQSATEAALHFVKRLVPHAVNVLSSISICVCAFILCMHAFLCVCIYQTGNWQAADPLWVVFIFHSLPVSSHKAPAFSLFLIFLFIPFSFQYLPGNNCDMNHFRQGGAQLWEQNSSYKTPSEDEKLYFDSHSASNWLVYKSSLCLCVYFLSDFGGKH